MQTEHDSCSLFPGSEQEIAIRKSAPRERARITAIIKILRSIGAYPFVYEGIAANSRERGRNREIAAVFLLGTLLSLDAQM